MDAVEDHQLLNPSGRRSQTEVAGSVDFGARHDSVETGKQGVDEENCVMRGRAERSGRHAVSLVEGGLTPVPVRGDRQAATAAICRSAGRLRRAGAPWV